MPLMADNAKETSATTGTGTYNLDGAVASVRGFVAAVGDGEKVVYLAEDGTDYEIGEGVITDATPDTLTRATILHSSNSDAAVNWGAGDKTIAIIADDRMIMGGGLVFGTEESPTTGNVTLAVGEDTPIDPSGITADRTIILPDGARVGDVVAFHLTDDAPTDYEMVLATGGTGSLLRHPDDDGTGEDLSDGTGSTYRFFISGESARFECINAGGAGDTDWLLRRCDLGLVPQHADLRLTTDQTGINNNQGTNIDYGANGTMRDECGDWFDTADDGPRLRRDCWLAIVAGFMNSSGERTAWDGNHGHRIVTGSVNHGWAIRHARVDTEWERQATYWLGKANNNEVVKHSVYVQWESAPGGVRASGDQTTLKVLELPL